MGVQGSPITFANTFIFFYAAEATQISEESLHIPLPLLSLYLRVCLMDKTVHFPGSSTAALAFLG